MADKFSSILDTELITHAADSTFEGITISDMQHPDQPLIYANRGFEELTGYSKEDVIGKNCRFLQGEATNRKIVHEIRQCIASRMACTVELLNYRKNGTPFWNRLSLTPIFNKDKQLTHYVGVQSDITELKRTRAILEDTNTKLSHFQERILKELKQARQTQEFILPSELPSTAHWKFQSMFVPLEQIGGDFYDVVELNPGVYGLLIADVTGHGIPASLLTFMSSTTFKNTAPGSLSPAETLSSTNSKLYGKMPNDAFVTMFYAILDTNSKTLRYCQAGHPAAMLIRSSANEIISLETRDPFIGILSQEELFLREKMVKIEPGDKFIMYTDAILDLLGIQSNAQGEEVLKQFLKENGNLSLEKIFRELFHFGLDESHYNNYPDDFTLLGFHYSP